MRAVLLLSLVASAAAHIGRPRHGCTEPHLLAKRQGGTEASESSLENPTQECTAYTLPEINPTFLAMFPQVWTETPAEILPGDTEAMQYMQMINASNIIPTNIGVRGGQNASSWIGAGLAGDYDIPSDPDCWWTDKECTTPKNPGIIADVETCPTPQTWGYTVDDGPNCTQNALYDFWKQNNQKVSLMYIGSNVINWPLQAQRAITDGHHVCAHTWSHKYMTSLTTDQAFAELWYTIKAIKYVMGVTVTCWRPPYGDVDDRIRAIAQGLGLRTIMWSDDTNDYNVLPYGTLPTASIEANYASIESIGSSPAAATAGVIVLQHELEDAVMSMAIEQYPNIKKSFKSVVPLNACLNITKPYYEDFTFPDFADYVAGKIDASPSGQTSIAISSASYSLTPLAYVAPSSAAGAAMTSAPAVTATSTPSFSQASAPGNQGVNTDGAAASVISSGGKSSSSSSSGSATLIAQLSIPFLSAVFFGAFFL